MARDDLTSGKQPSHPLHDDARREGARIDAELAGLGEGTDPFAAAVRVTRMPMTITNPRETGNPIVFANDAFCRLTGYTREEVIGRNCRFLQGPESDAATVDRIRAAISAAEPIEIDIRNHRKDGTLFWNRLLVAPVRDVEGKLAYFFANQFDVTAEYDNLAERTRELAEANERLRTEATERERAEEALRQSHKLEAIGQLTGGIAHDFNNMLQAIGGSLELMHRRVEQGRAQDAAHFVDGARQTVRRAASLTSRLLAFARRQTLQSKPVVLDTLIRGMAELIERTVGPSVKIELRLSDGDWTVLCDPNQMESALLNLAINARDAMPDGGTLTIGTEDVDLHSKDLAGQEGVKPGSYVEVFVTDTGIGMDETIRARAFEPFFTTKPIGQGTGLGLSQLYGFVRQSDGVVRIESAPGEGATVRVYLPRYMSVAEGTEQSSPQAEPEDAGTDLAVLLVEDEEAVRAVAAERLRELGYAVLEAKDGPAALQMLRSGAKVDVLVTDVGLPGGLNGRQVADAAREHRPALPVLFITGYAGTVLEEQLASGMQAIGKPFALDTLAAKVRAILGAAGG